MTHRKAGQRSVQRLLGRIKEDIEHAERFCAGRTRIQVANDPMRRDAVEQCLRRIGAITSQLTAIDEEVIAHLEPMLGLMQPLWAVQSVDRMDSDVLCGLVSLCCLNLRHEVDELLRRGQRSC